MSMRPGGKQHLLCAGWYEMNGVKQIQEMIFPHNHEKFQNLAWGLKLVLEEWKLWHPHLHLHCMSRYCQQCKQILIQRKSVTDGLHCQKEANYCCKKKGCRECWRAINEFPLIKSCGEYLLLCKYSED
ncbi:hypothetical protein L873DRAFT_900615 [Choiromyces venosus 120613-1]|uniref:Uncharacterized protein n=1 Tax=Choiromyces venosus 120613-1 TaxID=1336337 RepID=A0A3N4IWT3_9PEZI|nr:hypothetical protein L873DRAFT_900615 [Choiromyces venosus 120613-1]